MYNEIAGFIVFSCTFLGSGFLGLPTPRFTKIYTMRKNKIESKSETQRKLRKKLVEIDEYLKSNWLTDETRKHLLEQRKILSVEAFR